MFNVIPKSLIPGRCKWCLNKVEDGGTECLQCRSSLVFISPSWEYGKDGKIKEDPGWIGPSKLLPARYRLS